MSATIDAPSVLSAAGTGHTEGAEIDRPAALAAARVSRAGLVLGALGLGAAAFVIVRLLEAWRVTPDSSSHRITILGQRLSYPSANAGAIVVLALAVLGLVVIAIAIVGTVREVAGALRLHRRLRASRPARVNGALIFEDESPRAFCAGLLRPRVYVSAGALAALDERALEAVLMHEHHHARRRDPLRFAVGRVIAAALFFIPSLKELVRRQQALAELSADESAVNAAPGTRSALARAMLTFADPERPAQAVGVDPVRVDFLLGEPPSWRFPALLSLMAAAVIALIGAVAVLAGRVASGSATLAPPFVSHQPCVAVLAMIPAAVGLLAGYLAGRRRRTDY